MTTPQELRFATVKVGTDQYEQMVAIRNDVLRKPLGLELTEEERAGDFEHMHIAAFDEDKNVCGTVLLFPRSGGKAQFRQVAVRDGLRGKGVGTKLMAYAEHVASKMGHVYVFVHARDKAVPFYTKIGYEAEGNYFKEHGIPHILMKKTLVD